MRELFLLMEVPCVGNQLNAPMLFCLASSHNFKSVIWVSMLLGYLALSSAGFIRYALGLLLIPASFKSPATIEATALEDRTRFESVVSLNNALLNGVNDYIK